MKGTDLSTTLEWGTGHWTLDIKQLNLPSFCFSLVAQEEPEENLWHVAGTDSLIFFPTWFWISLCSPNKNQHVKIFDGCFSPYFRAAFVNFWGSQAALDILVREPRSEVGSGIRGQIPLRPELLRTKVIRIEIYGMFVSQTESQTSFFSNLKFELKHILPPLK